MATGRLVWDQVSERLYETGTDRGAVYPYSSTLKGYGEGEAWNGLRSVSESPDGAEETALFADNIKYLSLMSAENFKGSIGAYTYPDGVAILDGSAEIATGVTVGQQARGTFGFTYRTLIGNDTEKNEHGYKLHLVYGATLSPSQREYNSVNDSPEAVELSWDFTTTPIEIPGMKPSAHIVIDSTKVDKAKLTAFESILYGSDTAAAKLPTPEEVIAAFANTTPAAG